MKRADLMMGVFVTLMWGANFSVIEVGLKTLDPFVLTFLRFLCCALPAIFFVPRPKKAELKYLAIYGTLFGAGMWWVVNMAMYRGLSAGLSSVFLQFSAFFTIFLSRLFFKERISAIQMLGMILSVAGLIGIFLLSHEASTTMGICLVLFASLSWAVCNSIVKFRQPPSMVAFMVWSSAFSVPAILVLTIAVKGLAPLRMIQHSLTPSAIASVLFQAYVTTLFGYAVWNNLMKKYRSSQVAPLSLLVPVSGMLCSHYFLNESMDRYHLLAISLVITGIALFMNAATLRRWFWNGACAKNT